MTWKKELACVYIYTYMYTYCVCIYVCIYWCISCVHIVLVYHSYVYIYHMTYFTLHAANYVIFWTTVSGVATFEGSS